MTANNKKLALIAGAVVLIGGITLGVLAINKDGDGNSNSSQSANSSQSTNTTGSKVSSTKESSFAKLIAGQEDITCTFSYDDNGSYIKGVGYFSKDKKMRVNHTGTVDGKKADFSTIVSGDTSYYWDNITKQGFKYSIDPDTLKPSEDSGTNTSTQQGIDPDKDITFDCKKWDVDTSVFSPPSNINFTDLSNIKLPTIPSN